MMETGNLVVLFTLTVLYIFGAAAMKGNHSRHYLLVPWFTLITFMPPSPIIMNSHTRSGPHCFSAISGEHTQVILAKSCRDSGFLRRG